MITTVSSDSSEDEEEARKIREALCDESIYTTKKTADQINSRTFSEQQKSNDAKINLMLTEEARKLGLKSNRVHDKNDDEDDNILQTTPEFRAFVARQLSAVLDSVLLDRIEDGVWQVPKSQNVRSTGVRLFSDSKTLCTGDIKNEADRQQQNLVKTAAETYKHRKHKLSTSSESSEDEKIKACVFTVADIKKENEYLAVLEKQTAPSESIQTGVNGHSVQKSDTEVAIKEHAINQNIHNNTAISDACIVRKKKKKKKKKRVVTTNDNN
ncbi:hypothetical protein BsWGS_21698 [Bradybaena similaris]